MSRGRLALLATGVVVLLAAVGLFILESRYCLPCSDRERVERGAGLLCADSDSAPGRGLAMLERAARHGQPEALALFGELYLESLPERYLLSRPEAKGCIRGRLEPDRGKALGYFRRLAAAAELDGEMLYNLGVLLDNGILPEAELDGSAEDYFQRSAEKGSPFGRFAVGWGYHLQGDYPEAAHWFREAFEDGGHPEAAILLGDYHAHGRGVKRDRDQALVWYRKAVRSAKMPAFKGLVGNLELVANKRLNLSAAPQEGPGEIQPIRVEYLLQGSLDEYLVFARDKGQKLIGRVVREGEAIQASLEASPQPTSQQVSSMGEGLDWVLQSYAAGRYGTEQKFRFILVAE